MMYISSRKGSSRQEILASRDTGSVVILKSFCRALFLWAGLYGGRAMRYKSNLAHKR
jgi:hypothetical protein